MIAPLLAMSQIHFHAEYTNYSILTKTGLDVKPST